MRFWRWGVAARPGPIVLPRDKTVVAKGQAEDGWPGATKARQRSVENMGKEKKEGNERKNIEREREKGPGT